MTILKTRAAHRSALNGVFYLKHFKCIFLLHLDLLFVLACRGAHMKVRGQFVGICAFL